MADIGEVLFEIERPPRGSARVADPNGFLRGAQVSVSVAFDVCLSEEDIGEQSTYVGRIEILGEAVVGSEGCST